MAIDIDKDKLARELYEELRGDLAAEIDRRVYDHMTEHFVAEGDFDRALATAQRVAELDPESAAARFRLAKLLLRAERWREGGRELEASAELDSVALADRHWAGNNLYFIAYALFNTGQYKEAAEAFRGAQNLIDTWTDPTVLKYFHWHQGMALHLEGQYLDAAEAYRRAMVAPGPGDSCPEDEMDEDEVESAQDMNDDIEPFMEMAQKGESLDPKKLVVRPAFA
jgi:tetratricopeptide (TPR) repeat protein